MCEWHKEMSEAEELFGRSWVSYDLPQGSLGGGANLACWSLNGDTCLLLNWQWTA